MSWILKDSQKLDMWRNREAMDTHVQKTWKNTDILGK